MIFPERMIFLYDFTLKNLSSSLTYSTYYIRLAITICAAIYFITALVFTGLNLSGSTFSANPFLYMVMAGMMELPGYSLTVPIVNRWGRKVPLMIAYFICGVSILSIVLVPAGWCSKRQSHQ